MEYRSELYRTEGPVVEPQAAVNGRHAAALEIQRSERGTPVLDEAQKLSAAFDAAHQFCIKLGIEMHLSSLGLPADDPDAMAEEAHAKRRLLDNHPRDLSRDSILGMYHAAF